MMNINTIYQGNCLEVLKTLPDNSIDCCVTSPPYWGLRDYGTAKWEGGNPECNHFRDGKSINANTGQKNVDGGIGDSIYKDICKKCGAKRIDDQLGLEPTFQEYIDKLCAIFDEVKRVLKPTGTCWVNLGDSYSGAQGRGTGKGNEYGQMISKGKDNVLRDKCLCQIPSRFAIEMTNRGWILRNEIIWYKPNCMPSSVSDRFTVDFEKIFFFTKQQKYYFEQQFEPHTEANQKDYEARLKRGMLRWGTGENSKHWGNKKYDGDMSNRSRDEFYNPQGRNKRCVWTENTKYADLLQEYSTRQGMNRDRGNNLVEKRNLPHQKEFVDKLRENFTPEQISNKTGLPQSTVEHWFRYDESGFSYPTKEDWEKVNTDLFPELKEVWFEPDEISSNPQGRNKRCVWQITTKPYKEAHFATYPPKLIETPIKAGCPEQICNKCGKAREKVYKPKEGMKYTEQGNPQGINRSVMKWNDSHPTKNPRFWSETEVIGLTDCGCNAGFKAGIVLDPFMGSGTTGLVAKQLGRNYIGIELNPEYIKLAEKRIGEILI